MPVAVEVADVSHHFGERLILDGLGFTVDAGHLVALIGPTGCGKSTVLRILAGLVAPTSGRATIDGVSTIQRVGQAAYMPQADTLLPWRSALQNAMLGAQLTGAHTNDQHARELFERFGLAGFEAAWPRELSGGMRQRVALLRTLLTELPVLLLDEPFGALDAITRLDLHHWMVDLLGTAGRTTLLVTHDIDEALRLADRIVVMSARPGRVIDVVELPRRNNRAVRDVTTPDCATVKRRLMAALGAR